MRRSMSQNAPSAPQTPSAWYFVMSFEYDGLAPCSIVVERMLRECACSSGYHRALFGKFGEDVLIDLRQAVEPIRIVKRPPVDDTNVRKSLYIKQQLRPASCAKIDRDLLAAPFAGLRVGCRFARSDRNRAFVKCWLHAVRSASCSLACP